jgi:3-deoxy-D-manno-octulosonic-acid transferase
VGGTIAKVGGHNLLEPYLYGVPVVCGPYLFKTKETAMILSGENALFIAPDAEAVQNKLLHLIQDKNLRIQMGTKGQIWLSNNRGAVAKSLEYIDALLKPNIANNNLPKDNVKVEMIKQ